MGIAMQSLGHTVHIFERHPTRNGAGIMVTPPMFDYFKKFGVVYNQHSYQDILMSTRSVSTDIDNNLTVMDHPDKPRPHTSYNNLFKVLFEHYYKADSNSNYNYKKLVKSIDKTKPNTIIFEDNTQFSCDLIIGCDGIASNIRNYILGDDDNMNIDLKYAGYVAWRGIIPINTLLNPTLSSSSGFKFNNLTKDKVMDITDNNGGVLFHGKDNQFVGYTIPTTEINGEKHFNWVWYKQLDYNLMQQFLIDSKNNKHTFSIPKGYLNNDAKLYLKNASKSNLPSMLDELINATMEDKIVNNGGSGDKNDSDSDVGKTFLQVKLDGECVKYVTDEKDNIHNILLSGDASCVVRAHTVRATSKASFDAMTLYDLFHKYEKLKDIMIEYESITKENNITIMKEAIAIGNKSLMIDETNGEQGDDTRSLSTAMDANVNTRK